MMPEGLEEKMQLCTTEMNKPLILLLEPLADLAYQELQKQAEVIKPEELNNIHKEKIQGIITRGKGRVDHKLMDTLPSLKVVVRCGVGLDNIDQEAAKAKGIAVKNTPGLNAQTVAEHTVMLMLMALRRGWNAVESVKSGDKDYRKAYEAKELGHCRLGLLGMGNIGLRVARLAELFGAKIQYYQRRKLELDYEYLMMEELFTSSDVISLHLPLNDSTRGLIDEKYLSLMPKGAMVVNTARGTIINEDDMLQLLESGHINSYAADIAEAYRSNHPLYRHPSVILTPHIASLTTETFEEICLQGVEKAMNEILGVR